MNKNILMMYLLGLLLIPFLCLAIWYSYLTVTKALELYNYVTIVKIETNIAYCDSSVPMTYFSDGGGVCGYIAPVGVVVDAKFLRQQERKNTDEILAKIRSRTNLYL